MEDLEEEGIDEEVRKRQFLKEKTQLTPLLQDDSENEIRAGDDSDEPKSKKLKIAGNNAKAPKNDKKKK